MKIVFLGLMNTPKLSINQKVPIDTSLGVSLFIKREDIIDTLISGNKYRKLFYNLKEAQEQNHSTLLTFGGAFSNHIAAVSACGNRIGLKTIGIIRGQELKAFETDNPTLSFAKRMGMDLHYISRSSYKLKGKAEFISGLRDQFGEFMLIPEGGTNELAVKGCEEILSPNDHLFDVICCPVGTGGTIAGLINSAKIHQQIIGYSAVKDRELNQVICKFVTADNWKLFPAECGGYGKIDRHLIDFINDFKRNYNIPLDPLYTGKMMYHLMRQIKDGEFPKGTSILAIHTGGLQGVSGMNWRLKQTELPQLL